MPQSRFTDREERLASEGQAKYRGTARIGLEVLHFPRSEPRELDQKNIERLKKWFEKGQCDRVTRNRIPAVIDQSQLVEVLCQSGVSIERLLNNHDSPHPTLKFPAGFQLHCLHGQHRIQAARESLPPRERWWTVDLYLADADHELKTALIEEYSNEKPPTAGEIYCKISQYRRERNFYSETRWWSHLSKHETRCLTGLFRYPALKAAFDDLLDLPGLWGGMRISTLNKLISMRFSEGVLHYLEDIKAFWSQLLAYNEKWMRMLDNVTVKAVELMAPRHSKRDAQMLHGQLASGQIFAAFSPQDRDTIWSKLSTANGLIPSLFTLFEDLKYLQACASSMRHLVEPSPGQTLPMALDEMFFGSTENWDLAHRRLWLYAMAHYSKLPSLPKKDTRKSRLAKAEKAKPDEVVLSDFAALADQLGFQSDQISALKQRSSDREIARDALLNARKPDRYEYHEQTLEAHIEQIVRFFATATPLSVELSRPVFVSDDPAAAGVRCGFPDEEAHARDAKFLTIANLHAEVDEQGECVASFFVRRSVYFAFFGQPSETSTRRRSNFTPQTGGGLHVDLQQEPLGTLAGERNVSEQERAVPREEPRMEQERTTQDLRERNSLQQERQAPVEDRNNVREGDDTSRPTQRNQRRGTQLDLERLATDALARTSEYREDRPPSSPPVDDLEALVNSYQYLIRTDNVDSSAHSQQYEQNPDRQLQRSPQSSSIRIEFKIYERDGWRTDRSLLVDSSDPSEVERVTKKYMRKGIRPVDRSLNLLVPSLCFEAALADESNTIFLLPEASIKVNNQLVKRVPGPVSVKRIR